jgi:hypothetical protein
MNEYLCVNYIFDSIFDLKHVSYKRSVPDIKHISIWHLSILYQDVVFRPSSRKNKQMDIKPQV